MPLEQWRAQGRWPASFDRFWEKLRQRRGRQDGTRAMIDVLLLGRHALMRLLPGYDAISRLHGKVIVKDGVTYIPIYHPAAALYNSFLMAPLEQDFKAVKTYLDRVEERRRALAAAAIPVAKPEEQLTLFG